MTSLPFDYIFMNRRASKQVSTFIIIMLPNHMLLLNT